MFLKPLHIVLSLCLWVSAAYIFILHHRGTIFWLQQPYCMFFHKIFFSNPFFNYRVSFGFKSSKLPGHSITFTLLSEKNFFHFFGRWHAAKSCCKIPLPSGNIFNRNETALLCNELIYLFELIQWNIQSRNIFVRWMFGLLKDMN